MTRAGLTKRASCHTMRHSFSTHLREVGYDIRTVQELLGHKDIKTTMVYTNVLNRGGRGVHSPLDRLRKGVSVESRGIMRIEEPGQGRLVYSGNCNCGVLCPDTSE